MIGPELARCGLDVIAIVPLHPGQQNVDMLEHSCSGVRPTTSHFRLPLYRDTNADIYHSQEPPFGTFLAMRSNPDKKHVITFRDTRNLWDWWIGLLHPSLSYKQVISNYLYEVNFMVHISVRRADRWFTASKMLIPKNQAKYRLSTGPTSLPSPMSIPMKIQKSDRPLVSFVGGFDRRKRPQFFIQLAKQFPDICFEAIGAGCDSHWADGMISRYAHLPNLNIRGFINQFYEKGLWDLCSWIWILVNTSARESLPTTFVEATAYGCALLSGINPDGFASRSGYHVTNRNYGTGLQVLLNGHKWRQKGLLGMQYVRNVFSTETSIGQHIQMFQKLMDS